eukprot:CAMPEP_0113383756 /NCGR_PEP_ID=MMETSP0013_2-20120614/6522_1 /TAXON_ID=2843 ORGANISM="Skeletonema costatum, Strain 1716" /NCGR_SAMPLE_ID=MMETSP0013_2 /ASSEMBLY_ACC=CAM_ASM_000158 /LENGTH=1166 /DNA_ID=CAMNT_0000266305 /DNA_START=27 /DNA_END=3527 /DNA_ORIENTATION=- /assembly_acc=CAM_ASM_000158
MDIRNFFGKPKAGGTKKSGASAPSTKKAASSKKSSSSSKVAAAAAAPQKKTKEPSSKAAASKKEELTINVDDSDTDMEDVAPPKSSSSAAVTKKRKESPSNAAAKTHTNNSKNNNRRKIIIDSDDDDSDDDDVDFQPNQNNNDSDDDDYKEDPSIKSRAAKKPSKSSQPVKMKQSPKKPVKRSTAKTAAKDADDNKPPKFHPPSSQLLEHILNSNNMDVHIQSSLPQLPNNNDNNNGGSSSAFFTSLDTTMTPHCLTGLTFCFTGILSTNDDLTRQTNAQVSVASPSKADYYRNRRYDTAVSNDDLNIHGVGNVELSRDNATDIVKILGGRVTTTVSSKTDYLVAGNILEDGREVVEGSKYKKCLDIWNMFKLKQRQEEEEDGVEDGSPNKKQKTTAAAKKKKAKSKKKPLDANNLVEVIRGLNEFYALIHFLSEWKKGTLTEEERVELEAQQRLQQQPSDGGEKMKSDVIMAEVKDEKKAEETLSSSSSSSSIVKKEKSESPAVAVAPASANSSAKPAVVNPYAKPVANPYAKKPAVNPYAKKPVNPYAATKTSSAASSNNPYGSKKPSVASKPDHHVDSKALGPNALWADKYAPKSSQDILGNKTNVDKLSRWLDRWEGTFNNPKMKVKSLTAPNGPRKAALLSGPPGIGKTTTATLIARQSGRDVLELNASDARSKKALTEALGDVTGSQVLSFANQSSKKHVQPQKRVIIMDEVDGMGAGDRSGMAQLIQMIKNSKVPIICICNDRQSQKVRSLVQYCLDLRYQRPVKTTIARRAVEIGRMEGMVVEPNAAEAIAESCGNDIRQVLNCLQMWSCKKNKGGDSANMTYKDLKDRKGEINKDEVLRVSMFDACRRIVEGSRGVDGTDLKAVTSSLMKRSDAYFVDYMLMGLMTHQNYLKVCSGQFNKAKLAGDEEEEIAALNEMCNATEAMSDFGVVEENLRGGDQNWALLPLSAMLAVKVGHHAGGPNGGFLPGNAEFAGWLGKNSTRNKKIRLLGELRHHMNYKVSADNAELRMNYLPLMRKQLLGLLFDSEGARAKEAIELMDEYGLDRDDVFENLDEFVLNSGGNKEKKFADLDSKAKAAFTRAYNSMAHKAQALVSEQGAEKTKKKKGGGSETAEGGDLDAIDDDKNAAEQDSDDEDQEDMEALKKKFMNFFLRASMSS